MMRKPVAIERESAIFLIGMHKAFALRGVPASLPRGMFNRAVNTALKIAWKKESIEPEGEADMLAMVEMAVRCGIRDYGFSNCADYHRKRLIGHVATVNGDPAEYDDVTGVVTWQRAIGALFYNVTKDRGTWVDGETWIADGKTIRFKRRSQDGE